MDKFTQRYKTICTNETIYSQKDGFFYKLSELIKQTIGLHVILNEYYNIIVDENRIITITTSDKIIKYVMQCIKDKKLLPRQEKNARLSKIQRNQCFNEGKLAVFEKILCRLNEAVLNAPEIGECEMIDNGFSLPLALIARANYLFKNKKFRLAFEDYQYILNFNIPIINRNKILLKMSLCETFACQISISEFISKSDLYFTSTICKMNEASNILSKSVKFRLSLKDGKEAFAAMLINPGEVILAENPVASYLLLQFHKSHCQTCLRRFKISYGCPNCCVVQFCSSSCRNIALEGYHKYECNIVPILIGSGLSSLSHLALRIITQLGLQNCLEMYSCLIQEQTSDKFEKYLELYNLENHAKERTETDYFDRTLMSLFLLKCLKQSNFFDSKCNNYDNTHINIEEIIIGTLILKNLQILQFNAYEIYDIENTDGSTHSNKIPQYIGIGIYVTAARFNHECYPAVFRYFCGKKLIMKSSRVLEKGHTLAENYGPIFTKVSYKERRRHLIARYWFECQCPACTELWPLLKDIKYNYLKIRCTHNSCNGSSDVDLVSNVNRHYSCSKCGQTNIFSKKHENIIKKCILSYAHGITLMENQFISEAKQILFEALRTFHYVACPPHRFTHVAELGIHNCLNAISEQIDQ